MDSVSNGKQTINAVYTHVTIIVVAFVLMAVSSFLFTCRVERQHLFKEAVNAISSTEAKIIFNLMEPEAFLEGYSETIRSAIMQGENENNISVYLKDITGYLLIDDRHMPGFSSIYGYFDSFEGTYISGLNWTPHDDYLQKILERPWYLTAIRANGEVAVTEPYYDTMAGGTILTYTRRLFDDDGHQPLGIICLDINLGKILRLTAGMELTSSSYGILLDRDFNVIAHPYMYQTGMPIGESIDGDLAKFVGEMEQRLNISERKAKNFKNQNSIVFFREINNGWHLGIVIPYAEYYKSLINMSLFLIPLGSVFLAALIFMLFRISAIIKSSDLKTRQKSNFLATMSHEIRTPLNAILGITEIEMQSTGHPSATFEAFNKINNSGNLLLSIINDILDFSKIEAGKFELTPVKYEIASMINDVVQLNYIRYESKPIQFKLDIDENIPSILIGDELRIKQILNNLLSNAFKYTQRGQVTLKVGAECVGRGGGAVIVSLIFQVIDTGSGMTQEQINKLFDEYTRFNMEANRATEGTGLGMAITRNLVDLMYGKIDIKSTVGEGTNVTVHLPQKIAGVGISGVIGREIAENLRQFQLGNSVKIQRARIAHEYMPYGKVLIVDDVETNLYVAKGLMAPYGLNIDLATSGVEAIIKIQKGYEYDIIFMDHMMPMMDGIEATKLMREIGYSRPIVALTANAISGQADVFLNSGFDGFISKPIDIRQLNATLNRLIRDKQPAEVVEAAHREKIEMDKKNIPAVVQGLDSNLAEIFARDALKAVSVLETCMQKSFDDQDNLQMYVINVHAMKSALANIGEAELSAKALKLEQAGRDKDFNIITSETGGFLDALRSVVDEIKSKFEDNNINEDSEDSKIFLREKLAVFKESCLAYDKKTAKKTLNELKEKTWSNETRELLDKMSEHLLHSEFDDAAALVPPP